MRHFIAILLLLPVLVFGQYDNIRVDDPSTNDAEEVTIAINPVSPNYLAAGANISYFFYSADSGKTWNQTNLTSNYGVWGDPVVIFDEIGNLYFSHLSNPPSGYWIDRIVIQKSTDNGLTWNSGTHTGVTPPRNQDKEWLAVDMHSQYKGNVYISWTEFDRYGSNSSGDSSRILFSRSTDKGDSWMAPVILSDREGDCIDGDNTTEGAVPAVGPNGEVYVAWSGPLGIMFDRSFDGGVTWGEDIFVADQPGGWAFSVPNIYRCNGLPVTLCDTSQADTRGNVYVLWADQREGTSNTDIFLAKSTDQGTTWQTEVKVNDDTTDRHQFFPWGAIDQTTGYLYFVFYDRRETVDAYTDVYMAVSKDGGETFKNFKISESSFYPYPSVFFGDYTNIAAYDGMVYPIWMRLDQNMLSVWMIRYKGERHMTDSQDTEYPLHFELKQNYPNPFNPSTTIGYSLDKTEKVTMQVFDVLGNKVADLLDKRMNPGLHEVSFNAENLTSGVYIYRLQAGDRILSRKMLLMK